MRALIVYARVDVAQRRGALAAPVDLAEMRLERAALTCLGFVEDGVVGWCFRRHAGDIAEDQRRAVFEAADQHCPGALLVFPLQPEPMRKLLLGLLERAHILVELAKDEVAAATDGQLLVG